MTDPTNALTNKTDEAPGAPIRVLIAEDQALLRTTLAALLEAEPGMSVVGLAEDGARAVALATELRPDVVLMDIQMPGLTGIEATRRIWARMPRTTSTGTSRSTWASDVEALTPRQREVLLLIARGLSNTEIEVELGITRATCRSHITALLARLGARDRAQLVIVAYEAGLISPR